MKDYRHQQKHPNNPPAGLASYDHTLPSRKIYDYPDIDPHSDPELIWAGKKKHTSLEVENVALHAPAEVESLRCVREFFAGGREVEGWLVVEASGPV